VVEKYGERDWGLKKGLGDNSWLRTGCVCRGSVGSRGSAPYYKREFLESLPFERQGGGVAPPSCGS
jgi:hypothetical protein